MLGTIIARHVSRKIFDHLNNGDMDAFLKTVSEDAVLEFPGNLSISGEYKGHQAIREWMEKVLGMYSEYKFTVNNVYMKDIFAFGPSNIAAVEFDLEATLQNGSPYKNSFVILIYIKGGKAVRSRQFPFDFDAVRESLGE